MSKCKKCGVEGLHHRLCPVAMSEEPKQKACEHKSGYIVKETGIFCNKCGEKLEQKACNCYCHQTSETQAYADKNSFDKLRSCEHCKSKQKACEYCEPKPGNLITVDDASFPRCVYCGREIYSHEDIEPAPSLNTWEVPEGFIESIFKAQDNFVFEMNAVQLRSIISLAIQKERDKSKWVLIEGKDCLYIDGIKRGRRARVLASEVVYQEITSNKGGEEK